MLIKALSYFFADFNFKTRSVWFKRLLYVFLLVKCCYWLFYYNLLFGQNSIVYSHPYDIGFFKSLAFFLYNRESPGASLWFIVPLLILCIFSLFKNRIYLLFDFLIWFFVLNIFNKIYPTLTGGDYLLNQLLFFNIFISDKFTSHTVPLFMEKKNKMKICAHNFSVLAVIIQICLVYFTSAITKLGNMDWRHGKAVIMASEVNHFTLPFISHNIDSIAILLVFFNFLVLIYQLLFPLLIWVNKIKKPFIILGILMHLYIAFVMGLVSFGLIMILTYIYFWPAKEAGEVEFRRGRK